MIFRTQCTDEAFLPYVSSNVYSTMMMYWIFYYKPYKDVVFHLSCHRLSIFSNGFLTDKHQITCMHPIVSFQ